MSLISNARPLSGVFICMLLSACAISPQTQSLLDDPPVDIRNSVELDDVGFVPQEEYQCGPAALATMLNYVGIPVSSQELKQKVYIPERKGSLQIEMVAAARSYGLIAYKIDQDIRSLLREVDAGHPVLVFQNLSLDIWPKWHYAVVVGYDLERAEIVLRSGTIKRHTISLSTFENTWQRANLWAYVFVRPDNIPVTSRPEGYVIASHELYKAGHKSSALLALRHAIKRWPDHSLVLMMTANTEYADGDIDRTITIFLDELNLRPLNASAWNNLSYAFAAKNCEQQAMIAIDCAMKIAPTDNNIRQSYHDIKAMDMKESGECEAIRCPLESRQK